MGGGQGPLKPKSKAGPSDFPTQSPKKFLLNEFGAQSFNKISVRTPGFAFDLFIKQKQN